MSMKKKLCWWLIAGIIGLCIFIKYYNQSFIYPSVNFKINKTEAESVALKLLKEMKIADIQSYDKASIFSTDVESSFYLQRYYSIQKVNELANKQIPVWYWEIRWFKPLTKKEYVVCIEPSGKIKRVFCQLEEDDKGENLSLAKASLIANQFLDRQGIDLSAYKLIQSSTQKQKNRTDHSFIWERKGFKLKEATFKITIGILGNTIGEYNRYLKIPEKVIREYEKQKTQGMFLSLITYIFIFLLYVGAIIVLMVKFKNNDLRWRFLIPILGIMVIALLMDQINKIGVSKFTYQTEIDVMIFWSTKIIETIIGITIGGLLIFLTGSTGDSLSREVFKGIPSPSEIFRVKWLFTSQSFTLAFKGYCLAFMWAGYTVIFYAIGRKFLGIWMPSDTPSSEALSLPFPFLVPFTMGLFASINEEFCFRLFSISLLSKYIPSRFLPVFISALIWAFAHSDYSVFPVYIRGIELLIIGIILGYAFIRYGILVPIIAHYVFNILVVAFPLIIHSNTLPIGNLIIIVALALLPITPGVIWLIKSKNIFKKENQDVCKNK